MDGYGGVLSVELAGGSGAADRFAPHVHDVPALLEFHRYGSDTRTSFEEHLREAMQIGIRSLHFTVSPEHRTGFEAVAAPFDVVRGIRLRGRPRTVHRSAAIALRIELPLDFRSQQCSIAPG